MTRRQEYAQATRQAIVEAARRLFAERGFFATKVDDIAAEARVAPATVYAVTGGKQGLLAELITTWTTDPIVEATIATSSPPRPGRNHPRGRLRQPADARTVRRRHPGHAHDRPARRRRGRAAGEATAVYRAALVPVAEQIAKLGALRPGPTSPTPWTCCGFTSATRPTSPCMMRTAGRTIAPSTGWPTRPAANSSAAGALQEQPPPPTPGRPPVISRRRRQSS